MALTNELLALGHQVGDALQMAESFCQEESGILADTITAIQASIEALHDDLTSQAIL